MAKKAAFIQIETNKLSNADLSLQWHDDFDENEKLLQSVADSGITHPLTVFKNEHKLILIHGFRRLKTAQNLNLPEIPVQIIPEGSSLIQAYWQAIQENSLDKELSLPERLRILQNAEKLSGFDRKQWLQSLSLPYDQKKLAILKQMLKLNSRWQCWFAEKQIPVRRALNILRLTNLNLLSPLLEKSLTLSQMEQIATMLLELMARESLSLEDCIHQFQLFVLLENGASIANWIAKLREFRYPILTVIQKQNHTILQEMKLPASVQLHLDSTLEREELKFSILLRQTKELEEILKILEKNKALIEKLLLRDWDDES